MTSYSLPAPAGLPDGFGTRPATRDDVAALLRLIRGDQRSATGEATLGEDEITAWFDSARARDRADMLIVLRGGEPVGLWRVVRNFDDVYWVSVAADRSLPGAELDAVWTSGLDWLQRASLAIAAHVGVRQPRADVWVDERDPLAARHAEAAGFERVRAFFEMHLDLAGYTPPAPTRDVTIRPAVIAGADSPDLRAMYEVITESFRDHFDFHLRGFEDWSDSRLQDPLAARDRWFLAELGGEPVGGLISHNAFVASADADYVANLGVLRSGRGRGVAKALLHAAFARAQADGRAAVRLHVDAESPTGATRLYESVGMYRRVVGYDHHKRLGGDPTANG